MASHEVRRGHEVRGADGRVAEAQVGAGEAAGLLGVVGEVSLAVLVGVVADDLHAVLVGTHGTVGTEAVELSLEHASAAKSDFLHSGQAGEGDVVHDTDGEVVLGLGQGEVIEDADDLGGRGIVRTETVAAADDERTILDIVVSVLHVEVQRLAVGAGLLRAVEHSDALHALGNSSEEVLDAEGTIEVNADHTHLLAVGVQVVDSLAGCVGGRTHKDNHAVGILCAVVAEEVVLAAGDLGDLAEVLLNHFGNAVIVGVASLAVSEERLGVLGRTACDGAFGRHSAVAETLDVLFLHEGTDVLLVHELDLVVLVGGAEAVEEVHEGHAGLQRSEVSHSGEVHHLLHAALAEHGETSLTASHHVLMVTEDTEGVAGQCAGADVEDAGDELTGNLVHIGNHQEQTLRSGEGGGQRTSLQRAVNGTGSTSLGLHFLNTDGLTPQVLAAAGSPLVNVLRHGRRRGDGVDSSYLGEHIAHMSRSLVTITGDKFLFFCHNFYMS